MVEGSALESPLEVYVYGAGGHGRVVADAAQAAGFRVLGFLDDAAKPRETKLELPVLAPEDDWVASVAVALGIGDNATRRRIMEALRARDIEFVTVVHVQASVSPHASLGAGVVVLAQAVIAPGARVGDGAIVNHGAIVDHDAVIGDFAHVAPNATLGGGAQLGELAVLGAGATILPGKTVGRGSVVGAGAVVVARVPDGVVAKGVPARVARSDT